MFKNVFIYNKFLKLVIFKVLIIYYNVCLSVSSRSAPLSLPAKSININFPYTGKFFLVLSFNTTWKIP